MIRGAAAELVGTAFLVACIVGSGIAAQRLSPNDAGLQLLENALATAAALVAIILALGPVSGAHLNPVITLMALRCGGLSRAGAVAYVAAQLAGGALGAVFANLMYELPAVTVSVRERTGTGLWLGEVIATLGLVVVVFGVERTGRGSAAPYAVGAYIGAAYFFTASTSFANPAVTLARMLSDTFAGIAPASVPAFLLAQLAGGLCAYPLVTLLFAGSVRGANHI